MPSNITAASRINVFSAGWVRKRVDLYGKEKVYGSIP